MNNKKPYLSLVIPVYNEQESLPYLLEALEKALSSYEHEIIFVDDGSVDGSVSLLEGYFKKNPSIKVLKFKRNFGQTAALSAGFDAARGEVIICLDADMQNDPADIPILLEEMEKGVDVVSGWRFDRKDPWLSRRLPSMLANGLISFVTGVSLHDYGCTLKAYRRSALDGVRLYGEMHRFIPAWCAWRGAKVREVKVTHHPRERGVSKYGIGRTFKVLLDLITAKFFSTYLNKPSYLFGGAGLFFVFMGFWAGVFPFVDKFFLDRWGPLRVPFMILAIFLGLLGTQFIVSGLLAEILIRVYYENKDERPYRVETVWEHGEKDSSAS